MTQSELKHRRSSPIGMVDPVVRALHTLMYGLTVHCGTLWTIGLIGNVSQSHGRHDNGACANRSLPVWLSTIVLLHEYWVYLQHTNVLGNPYCQWLDRQYGIALLKSNQHWAIAGNRYRLTRLAPHHHFLPHRSFAPLSFLFTTCCRIGFYTRYTFSVLVQRNSGNVPLLAISAEKFVNQILDSLFVDIPRHQKSRGAPGCSPSVFPATRNNENRH